MFTPLSINPIFKIDFYKAGHPLMEPGNVVEKFINLTPRTSRTDAKEVVVMGIHPLIMELIYDWKVNFFDLTIDQFEVLMDYYTTIMDKCLYPGAVPVDHFRALYKLGYLPLEIKALPEGSMCPIGVPVVTCRNTHKKFPWLANYLETKISNDLWKSMTSATTAYQFLKNFLYYAERTGAVKDIAIWQGHDFSYRGMSGEMDAITSGMGHLASFWGTDTVPAVIATEHYYPNGDDAPIAGSIVATEHSVMCTGRKELEYETYERLLDQFKDRFISIVSDTWDYWNVIDNYLPRLKSKILASNGRFVIRPDSGNPADIICGVNVRKFHSILVAKELIGAEILKEVIEEMHKYYINCNYPVYKRYVEVNGETYQLIYSVNTVKTNAEVTTLYLPFDLECEVIRRELTSEEKGTFQRLWEIFGGTINEKGFKVLNPKIGLIYGDSITLARQIDILKRLEEKGFTHDNLVLGIGSYTYEYVTRDVLGFAVKATNIVTESDSGVRESVAIFKDPKTTSGTFSKKSAKGLIVVEENENGILTIRDEVPYEEYESAKNMLELISINGSYTKPPTLNSIRTKVWNSAIKATT